MSSSPSPVKEGVAGGISIGAAALLFVAAVLSIVQGISAIANDKLFVVGPQYLYSFDLTGWGWIHLLVGILAVVISIGMIMQASWALISAIVIASVSIVAQFLWLPYYPWWAVLVIALDVLVIWAASTWRQSV